METMITADSLTTRHQLIERDGALLTVVSVNPSVTGATVTVAWKREGIFPASGTVRLRRNARVRVLA